MKNSVPSISIIIPTYNEEARIEALLHQLTQSKPDEIIVVDGGSSDRTAALAAKSARVLHAATGRAVQMNAGARAATGDVLLFVHADSTFGPTALDVLRVAMRDPVVPGGNFNVIFEGSDWVARSFTGIYRWRRKVGIFYGDSAVFCRRAVFEQLDGYKALPVMEDYEFIRRLWKLGRLALLDEPVWSSDRRWKNAGLLATLLSWVWIQGLYSLGVSPHRLAGWYRHVR
jgi:rSAM/selenodomain-associated transferase 2